MRIEWILAATGVTRHLHITKSRQYPEGAESPCPTHAKQRPATKPLKPKG